MRCYVWSDLSGTPTLVGRSEIVEDLGEFRYSPDYVASKGFSIDPINLPLDTVAFTTRANKGTWGVLADAGPDAWGRKLLTNKHPRRMATANGLDVLMMSTGYGTGALLFSGTASTVQVRPEIPARKRGIRLSDLGAAAEAAYQVEMGEVLREQLRLLLESGTALGGLHPKVAATDANGVDWIAKFKGKDDIVDTPRVECAAMRVAKDCGLDVATVEFTAIGERSAALIRRFDRYDDGKTLHYASASALWNRERFNEADALTWSSYAGIVRLAQGLPGIDVTKTAEEIFRRLAFNVIIGNTDDHGRNHGFLMDPQGVWRLAPAFDVLPTSGSSANVQALGAGPGARERSKQNVVAGAASFGLNLVRAAAVFTEMAAKVREVLPGRLKEFGVSRTDTEVIMARLLD